MWGPHVEAHVSGMSLFLMRLHFRFHLPNCSKPHTSSVKEAMVIQRGWETGPRLHSTRQAVITVAIQEVQACGTGRSGLGRWLSG